MKYQILALVSDGFLVSAINIVIIYAKFQELRLDEEKGDEETSPYHLVKAQKVGTWVEKIVFNLVVADSPLATPIEKRPLEERTC